MTPDRLATTRRCSRRSASLAGGQDRRPRRGAAGPRRRDRRADRGGRGRAIGCDSAPPEKRVSRPQVRPADRLNETLVQVEDLGPLTREIRPRCLAKRSGAANHLSDMEASAEPIGAVPVISGLLDRIRARDESALTALVETFDRDLIRLAFMVCGDRQTAEDATQTTWERLWRNPPKLRAPDQLKSWLLTVAANEARQVARRQRRGVDVSRPGVVQSTTPPTDDVEHLDLANALARLSAEQRELLGLRFVLEQSSATIAAHLGITPEGARSRVHRALNQLRSEMNDG